MSNTTPLQLLRSNTANKRPDPTALADGRPAINTNAVSPGLFFKDSAGNLVKVGPVHVGTTAPNASPASGGAAGNSLGEQWLDTTGGVYVLKIWDGSAWRSETGTFVDASGDTMTGALVMDNQQQVRFREVTANGTNYIALQAPASVASDKTITLPDVNGTVVTTGDTGTVTSTMIADATIVDADISASAEIAVSKLADGTARQLLQTDAAGTGVEWTSNVDVPGTLDVTGAATFDSTVAVTGALTKSGNNVVTVGDTGTVTSTMILDGTIVNADVNASAAIAGTKISPDFGSQNVTTTGTNTAASFTPTSSTVPANGVYLPAANSVAISTGGFGRLFVDASGRVGVGVSSLGDIAAGYATLQIGGTNGGGVRVGTSSAVAGYMAGSASGVEIGTTGTTALNFFTNSQTRATITSAGLVGVGTSSPSEALHVVGNGRIGNNTTNPTFTVVSSNTGNPGANTRVGTLKFAANANNVSDITAERNCGITATTGSDERFTNLDFYTSTVGGGAPRVRIDSSGNVGIGTTSPAGALNVQSSASNTWSAEGNGLVINGGNVADAISTITTYYDNSSIRIGAGVSQKTGLLITGQTSTAGSTVQFRTGNSERVRIDSSGRLLVGTSSSPSAGNGQYARLVVQSNTAAPAGYLSIQRNEAATSITSAEEIGLISFGDSAGNSFATINCVADADAGANDYPGRLVFSTTADGASSPTVRATIDSSGRLLVGTSSSSADTLFRVQGKQSSSASNGVVQIARGQTNPASDNGLGTVQFTDAAGSVGASITAETELNWAASDYPSRLIFATTADNASSPTERLRITSAGRVGIGTQSPGYALDIINNSTYQLRLASSTSNYASGGLYLGAAGTGDPYYYGYVRWNQDSTTLDIAAQDGTGSGGLRFLTNGGSTSPTERARIDVSGRLLVGTSSVSGSVTSSFSKFQIQGNTYSSSGAGILAIRNGTAGASIVNGTEIGQLVFSGSDNTDFARIDCVADGATGANDYPSRLVFSTTADGASSPTERMRILSDGNVIIGKAGQTVSYQNPGINLFSSGSADFTRASAYLISVNRKTDDGVLVEFYQDNNLEGTISVSGTTVSYNGAHLSRWSQLSGGVERTEILRGTVLSNIDEMCEWGEENNEQLNRMKVSDVEGDKNVSGVFQAWDDDDDTYTNDFYCAMTGDFIIRIAAGVTVERGDLLMSAGDGTAKPQGDDIIRSKTVAKITSTNVSCTYDDGSYCVPCVLMAC